MTPVFDMLQHSLWTGSLICAVLLLMRVAIDCPHARYRLNLAGLLFMAVLPPVLAFLYPGPEIVFLEREPSPLWIAGWGVGALVASLRTLGGWSQLRAFVGRSAVCTDPEILETILRLSARLGLKRPPVVRISTADCSPCTLGGFPAYILMPASLLTQLPPPLLETLLAHEIAHIKRWDYWVNFFQNAVESIYFFHPAVWIVSHQMRVDRELCCDELTLRITGDRLTYARALAAVAGARIPAFAPASAAGSVEFRIRRMFGLGGRRGLAHVAALFACIAAMGAMSGASRPTQTNAQMVVLTENLPSHWEMEADLPDPEHFELHIDVGEGNAFIRLDRPGRSRQYPWFYLSDGERWVRYEAEQSPGGPIVLREIRL